MGIKHSQTNAENFNSLLTKEHTVCMRSAEHLFQLCVVDRKQGHFLTYELMSGT
jgi:hypothetical protein